MFYIKYLTMYIVRMQAGAIKFIVWLCACMGDNPPAKVLGLSYHRYAYTIQWLSQIKTI